MGRNLQTGPNGKLGVLPKGLKIASPGDPCTCVTSTLTGCGAQCNQCCTGTTPVTIVGNFSGTVPVWAEFYAPGSQTTTDQFLGNVDLSTCGPIFASLNGNAQEHEFPALCTWSASCGPTPNPMYFGTSPEYPTIAVQVQIQVQSSTSTTATVVATWGVPGTATTHTRTATATIPVGGWCQPFAVGPITFTPTIYDSP